MMTMNGAMKKVVVYSLAGLLQLGLATGVAAAAERGHDDRDHNGPGYRDHQRGEEQRRYEDREREQRHRAEMARHEREMQRRQWESERAWHERQERENERHEQALRDIGFAAVVLAILANQ